MAAGDWEAVNPDNAVDLLPQPFRSIGQIVDEVLHAVGEGIDELEGRKRSTEYEHALPGVLPTKVVAIAGSVTCIATEARGTPMLAAGTTHGEVCLLDTVKMELLAQRHVLEHGEHVHCVALCSDGTYSPRPTAVGGGPAVNAEPVHHLKLFIAGRRTPRVTVFDICRSAFGSQLRPACAIQLPGPPDVPPAESGDGEVGASAAGGTPVVEQLRVRGCCDGIWVTVLLFDGALRVYMCPLGAPEKGADEGQVGGGAGDGLTRPILEENEEADDRLSPAAAPSQGEVDGRARGEDGPELPLIVVPAYNFSIAQLAQVAGSSPPSLGSISLAAFSLRMDTRALALGTASRQVPLVCMTSSSQSNVLLCHSLPAIPPVFAAKGLDVDELLETRLPEPGAMRELDEVSDMRPRRRWQVPGKVTASATSPDGALFTVGTATGCLAMVNTAAGPALRMLPLGHYAAVVALAFHRAEVLVSAGADSWVHHYSTRDGALLARFMCSPPPTSPPAVSVVTAHALPLAVTMDSDRGLRLVDLRRGGKLARLHCCPTDAGSQGRAPVFVAVADGAGTGDEADARGGPKEEVEEDEAPRFVAATCSCFLMTCERRSPDAGSAPLRGQIAEEAAAAAVAGDVPDAKANGAAETVGSAGAEALNGEHRTCLALFDFNATLKALDKQATGAAMSAAVSVVEAPAAAAAAAPASAGPLRDVATGVGDGLTLRIPADADVSTLKGALAATIKPHTQPEQSPKKATVDSPSSKQVVRLTAENLKRMGRTSVARAGAGGGQPSTLSSCGAREQAAGAALGRASTKEGQTTRRPGYAGSGHWAAPDNWQVAVRRYVRQGMAQREVRLRHANQRVQQLLKEVGAP